MGQLNERSFDTFAKRVQRLEMAKWRASRRLTEVRDLKVFPVKNHNQVVEAVQDSVRINGEIRWIKAMRECGISITQIMDVWDLRNQVLNPDIKPEATTESVTDSIPNVEKSS